LTPAGTRHDTTRIGRRRNRGIALLYQHAAGTPTGAAPECLGLGLDVFALGNVPFSRLLVETTVAVRTRDQTVVVFFFFFFFFFWFLRVHAIPVANPILTVLTSIAHPTPPLPRKILLLLVTTGSHHGSAKGPRLCLPSGLFLSFRWRLVVVVVVVGMLPRGRAAARITVEMPQTLLGHVERLALLGDLAAGLYVDGQCPRVECATAGCARCELFHLLLWRSELDAGEAVGRVGSCGGGCGSSTCAILMSVRFPIVGQGRHVFCRGSGHRRGWLLLESRRRRRRRRRML
jgi:hypothetical protein